VWLSAGVLLLTGACTSFAPVTTTPASTRAIASLDAMDDIPIDLVHFLQPFPPATSGQVRWVIVLPQQADEDRIRVELLPSIRIRADCNHHFASAKIENHTLQGWGYNYAVMGTVGPLASTLMACPDALPQERDIIVQADLPLQRYNSRVPIVFYTPETVTLRYRLWHGAKDVQIALPVP